MKSIMKNLTTIKSIPVLTLVLLVVLVSSFVKSTAQNPEPGPVYSADNTVIASIAGKLHATISLYSIEDDIAAIDEVLVQYGVAMDTGDLELYMSLHADDIVKMGPDAPATYGKEELRAGTKFLFDNFTIVGASSPEETYVDGNMGFTRGTYTLSIIPKAGGDTAYVDGKYLTLCKRQADGSWKISHDCYNSNVPPAQ
jgi:ketosteroid isomerase-like protein